MATIRWLLRNWGCADGHVPLKNDLLAGRTWLSGLFTPSSVLVTSPNLPRLALVVRRNGPCTDKRIDQQYSTSKAEFRRR